MSKEDSKAIEAAALYAGDEASGVNPATFKDIADKLGVSKSHAQVLVRRGLAISLRELGKDNPGELTEENPGDRQILGETPLDHVPAYPEQIPPSLGRPEAFTLVTSGISKNIVLTVKELMIYDLFCGAGFPGDLSSFIIDAVNFLYDTRPPANRRLGLG